METTRPALRTVVIWATLVLGPLVLAGIELFHPAGFTDDPGAFQYLTNPDLYTGDFKALDYPGPTWWFVLHMIQTPLVVLVVVGLFVLIAGLQDWAALLSRVALVVFGIYYTVLDAVGGIGLGRTLMAANRDCQPVPAGDWVECTGSMSTVDYNVVGESVNTLWTDQWAGGTGSVVSQTGSWAAFAAFALVAVTLVLNRRSPVAAAVALAVAGYFLQLSHTAFNGPIAFGLLAATVVWIWLWQQRTEADAAT